LGAFGTLAARRVFGAKPESLRPPGAIGEPGFSGLCVRCGNCIRNCPSKILHPDVGQHGVAGLLTPVLRFGERYCHENCCRCGTVCPSGAIRHITLADKPKTVIGRPELDFSLCRRFYAGGDCSGCANVCPYGAIVFEEDGLRTKPSVLADRCNGCGACEAACPATPKALVVKTIRQP
jgi:ferredoxin